MLNMEQLPVVSSQHNRYRSALLTEIHTCLSLNVTRVILNRK